MPSAPATRARVGLAVAASVITLAATAGCGAMGDAQQLVDRARLVNDLATRLDDASGLTYTAEYQLPGGASASIAQAQQPLRIAYTYPGGKFLVTADRTAECRMAAGSTTCVLNPAPSTGADPTAPLLRTAGDRGLVPPTLVVSLLTAASLSPNAVVNQHDTTTAGEHASCVDVSGVENAAASQFTACITAAGVLGEFHGTVNGTLVDVVLTRYRSTVAEDAFDPPPGALMVDQRPGR